MKRLLPMLALVSGGAALADTYNGALESATCTAISGWAWDTNQPTTSINVDLYDGSTFIDTVTANVYRGDLNFGTGYYNYGFSYPTPQSLKNGQNHTIHAYISGTSPLLELSYSPLTLNLPASATCYQYYYSDAFPNGSISSYWTQKGTITTDWPSGLTSSDSNGGSVISNIGIPGGGNLYEVKATLSLPHSGGTYVLYLQASSDALSGPTTSSGSYYAWEIQNPTFSGGSCSATWTFYKRVSGAVSQLASGSIGCYNGMALRLVYTSNNQILGWYNNQLYLSVQDSTVPAGQPGVGVRNAAAGNDISRADLGPHDGIAPNPVSTNFLAVSPFPNRVDFEWQGTTDDPNGSGIGWYEILRGGTYVASAYSPQTEFSDPNVSPGTTYTYSIVVSDIHNNTSTMSFSVTTPPVGAVDARRVGVRPTGSYWGGGGESIDMRSGNLNFTIPLLKVKGRGWNVPFSLSYNSENWRQDAAGNWNLGRDGGFCDLNHKMAVLNHKVAGDS